jgi:hypothetical protein
MHQSQLQIAWLRSAAEEKIMTKNIHEYVINNS